LKSDQWKVRRQLRLEKDSHNCNDCGKTATQVHHLTYERIGNEHLDDLLSLCERCHAARHGEAANRISNLSMLGIKIT
jgi:5-methylcytosine-specific restriction endonuclease McrA